MTRQELQAYNDAMMTTAADEYAAWLADMAAEPPFEDSWLAEAVFWLTEDELYQQDAAALRADLCMF